MTKGHTKQECTVETYCEICDAHAHNTDRCPTYRAAKEMAIPCGYAIEGLGFYYIPESVIPKQRINSNIALVRVDNGSLSTDQVTAELTRLVSNTWRWNVQNTGKNVFRVPFPSMEDIQRMVEWGVVHTKFGPTMKIEETAGGRKLSTSCQKYGSNSLAFLRN